MTAPARPQILLVEDDLDTRDLIKNFFRQKNFDLIHFDNAEDAIEALKKGLELDVIITDLKLPNMSGLEFTQTIKTELGVETPIIVTTATRTLDAALKAIESGAYDFIVKPIPFPQLLVSIERAIHLNQLNKENVTLREVIKDKTHKHGDIITKSASFQKCIDLAKRVSTSLTNILITGESGTGKEIIAKLIHSSSPRKNGPFIAINCSAIPETLLESELFGYAKGSFTGATDKKLGLFEAAENGTIFLDEIGDLSLPLQAKLLRVLQERKIKRIGENSVRAVNARVISATHKELKKEVGEGKFREDLFFRLNVIPIHLPPLRERKEDILPLAEYFLEKYRLMNGVKKKEFSKKVLQTLIARPWKGNVRELENTIERCVVLSQAPIIEEADLFLDEINLDMGGSEGAIASDFSALVNADGRLLTMNELSLKYIDFALKRNNGAKDKTAKELGIDRKTLYRKIQEMSGEEMQPSAH